MNLRSKVGRGTPPNAASRTIPNPMRPGALWPVRAIHIVPHRPLCCWHTAFRRGHRRSPQIFVRHCSLQLPYLRVGRRYGCRDLHGSAEGATTICRLHPEGIHQRVSGPYTEYAGEPDVYDAFRIGGRSDFLALVIDDVNIAPGLNSGHRPHSLHASCGYGWRYFLEETDLVPGMSADEATKLRQARLERRESES